MTTEECGWKDRTLNAGLLALRVFMGLAIASHGYQKVFGGQVEMLTQGLIKMGMPAPHLLAWLAALSEFAGGLLIALGLGTRIAAFFVFFTMSVAFFKAHAADPWQVKELAYMYGTIALSLILMGGGCYSLDALFCCRSCKVEPKDEQKTV
jgi:putative oxidoreductase